MVPSETIYLVMVIVAFSIFGGVLAFVSWYERVGTRRLVATEGRKTTTQAIAVAAQHG